MKFLTTLICNVILILSVSSCSKESAIHDLSTKLKTSELNDLNDSNWVFANYVKNPVTVSYLTKITLTFNKLENGKLTYYGKSSINLYNGDFTVKEGTGLQATIFVTARLLGYFGNSDNTKSIDTSTKNSIKKSSTFDEQQYYANIEKSTFFEIKNNKLYIYTGSTLDNSTEILVYDKQ